MTRVTALLATCHRILLLALQLPARILVSSANVAIGGQAVMEGVMMRSPQHWAVAMRRRSGEIAELHREHTAFARNHSWARLPIIRGVVALVESLTIGFKALSVSAHYAAEDMLSEDDEMVEGAAVPIERPDGDQAATEHGSATDKLAEEAESVPEGLGWWQILIAFVFAFGFSILLFKVIPVYLVDKTVISTEKGGFVFVEAAVRISFFCFYLVLVGWLPDMKRVFQYHSAEHKAINAWENNVPLEPERVNEMSRIHVRCGTAFMLWVFVVAIAVFGIFGHYVHPTLLEAVASRVLFLPLIAGISFELIRFAGKKANNRLVRGVLAPGLWLQHLTTRECTPDQCEVAIRSLELVVHDELPNRSLDDARRDLLDDDEAMQVMA